MGQLAVQGELTPADSDILIGRVRQPTLPFPEAAIHPSYPIWYSLDGILDEVEIYNQESKPARNREHLCGGKGSRTVTSSLGRRCRQGPLERDHLEPITLRCIIRTHGIVCEEVGTDSDVVVRFDESPIRLVFWQGTDYVPAWVTENDKWYTDEFLETWGTGCPLGRRLRTHVRQAESLFARRYS